MTTHSITQSATKNQPLTRIDRERGIVRRSKRLPLSDAQALCRRVANLRFVVSPLVVDIRDSKRGLTAVVQWSPSSDKSKQAMRDWFRASRMMRAAEQLPVMSFYEIENRPGLFAVVNDDGHGGGSHMVDLVHEECDCEDFAMRCRQLGEKCHHLHALDMHVERATLPPVPVSPSPDRAERAARCLSNVCKDF